MGLSAITYVGIEYNEWLNNGGYEAIESAADTMRTVSLMISSPVLFCQTYFSESNAVKRSEEVTIDVSKSLFDNNNNEECFYIWMVEQRYCSVMWGETNQYGKCMKRAQDNYTLCLKGEKSKGFWLGDDYYNDNF